MMQQQQQLQQQQQPMSYGQGMYGSGAMPYGSAGAGMPYQQQGYGMQPQMMRPGMAPQMMPMGGQMSQYGQGYIDAGDGRPAMVYGGPNEGLGGMPSGYRPSYGGSPGYSPRPMQGYAQGSQMGYQQGYLQGSQPQYPQGSPQLGQANMQPAYQQGYPQTSQQQYPQGSPQPLYQNPQASGSQVQYPQGSPQPNRPNVQPAYQNPQASQSQYSIGSQQSLQPNAQTTYQNPQTPQGQYPQGSLQPSQSNIQPASLQLFQQSPQAPIYPTASQPQPQDSYFSTSQPTSNSPAPSTELPATQPHPHQVELPGSIPTTQPNQTTIVQPTPQPTRSPSRSPVPQLNPQQNYASPQPSLKQGETFSPVPQSPAPPAYSSGPQSALQPTYSSNFQANLSTNYAAGTQKGLFAAPQPQNPSYQQFPQPMQTASYGPQYRAPPTYLHPIDTMVKYDPVPAKADTHHHALKSLHGSSMAPEVLTAILGTYLASKQAHEGNHIMSATSTYRHARPEIQTYCHTMDKLDSLSVDFIAKHKSTPPAWLSAIGPHRRHVFATLYNSNEIVRNFCNDIPGGPMALPELDQYGLGKTVSNFSFPKAFTRPPNLSSPLSLLSKVRTVIVIDDSGSMMEAGHQSWGNSSRRSEGYTRSESRWMQARNLLASLAPLVAQHSPHGIDLHFLNRVPFYSGLVTSAAVEAAFDGDYPNNGTPTGQVVNDILDAYMCALRHFRNLLPLNLIVITDGEAQDEHILHWTIEHHVTKIVHRGFPAHQFGVEFVQVGDCQYATKHLIKLEEEVSRHHMRFQRDVVGVTPTTRIGRMDAQTLLGIATSGIDARMNGYMRARGVNV